MVASEQREPRVLRVDPDAPDLRAIEEAADVLRRGGLVAFPTETVYGLGALALNPEAVARIFAAKQRPGGNPLIVHVANAEAARRLVVDWPAAAERLVTAFWPGPLTLVLRCAGVPSIVTAGGPTVALRAPRHGVALALLRAVGEPLAAPSANASGRISPTMAAHVVASLGGRVDLILDGGATPGGIESTVVDLTGARPRILRPGLVSAAQIAAVAGACDAAEGARGRAGDGAPVCAEEDASGRAEDEAGRRGAVGDGAESGGRRVGAAGPLASPGLLARHYAPRTPLELCDDWAKRCAELRGRRVGLLRFERAGLGAATRVAVEIGLPADPEGCAARLYAVLHQLDAAGLDVIVVERPPAGEAWAAIRDRLERAAHAEIAGEGAAGPGTAGRGAGAEVSGERT